MMDETAGSSTLWEYQKRVAALVALTQQVINPIKLIFFNKLQKKMTF
jgi:hypothetical protein